jgi:UDP-N-acetylglucosamine acyltransferase
MQKAGNHIHPSAYIGPDVQMGTGNFIGAFSYLDGKIKLGNDNKIWNHVVLHGNIELGNQNEFFPFVSIGLTADIPGSQPPFREDGNITIGHRNTLKSYVHLQSPMRTNLTSLGDDNYFMPHAYVAHDCRIGNRVILSGGAKIAGVCILQDYVNAGVGAVVHQRCTIGESAFLGMNATITKHIPPFSIVTGSPTRILKMNRKGMENRGIKMEDLDLLEASFRDMIASNSNLQHPAHQSIQAFFKEFPDSLRLFH